MLVIFGMEHKQADGGRSSYITQKYNLEIRARFDYACLQTAYFTNTITSILTRSTDGRWTVES